MSSDTPLRLINYSHRSILARYTNEEKHIQNEVGCVYFICDSHYLFLTALSNCEAQPDLIIIHQKVITDSPISPKLFIENIFTTVKLMSWASVSPKSVKIVVEIDATCTPELLGELKKSAIVGVISSDITLMQYVHDLKEFLQNDTWWNQEILNRITSDKKHPVLLMLLPQASHVDVATNYVINELTENINIIVCNTWTELPKLISECHPDIISVHMKALRLDELSISESVTMLMNYVKYIPSAVVARIAVVIDNTCSRSIIKELRKSDIAGIIPSLDFGITETAAAAVSLLSKGHSWPTHIIESLPSDSKKKISHTVGKIYLTNRQQEIVKLICLRGLSNKRIAAILNITESTVKIHVSAALKAYGVRTRTQLALSYSAGSKT